MFTTGVLTISDKGAGGRRQDLSGEVIKEIMSQAGSETVKYEIVPDEQEIIADRLSAWADEGRVDVILTTGGTGLGRRDVTPEATLGVVEKVIPGFGEAMRLKSLEKTPMAMLSRATAGVRNECLIINLPGSPKAVRECLEAVLPAVPHAVEIIKGKVTEHSIPDEGGAA